MSQFSVRARHRPHSTPEERAAWVRQYECSGLSQVEFADEHQLTLSTLRRWIAQRRSPEGSPGQAPAAWQELKLPVGLGPIRWAAEVVRPDGWTLRVAPEASPAWVGELLRASSC